MGIVKRNGHKFTVNTVNECEAIAWNGNPESPSRFSIEFKTWKKENFSDGGGVWFKLRNGDKAVIRKHDSAGRYVKIYTENARGKIPIPESVYVGVVEVLESYFKTLEDYQYNNEGYPFRNR